MLTSTASVTSASTTRQIAVPASTTTSGIIYTVPNGRKFVGNIFTNSDGQPFTINGVQFTGGPGGGAAVVRAASLITWTLLQGTVVREGSSNSNVTSIFGIESDA